MFESLCSFAQHPLASGAARENWVFFVTDRTYRAFFVVFNNRNFYYDGPL